MPNNLAVVLLQGSAESFAVSSQSSSDSPTSRVRKVVSTTIEVCLGVVLGPTLKRIFRLFFLGKDGLLQG